MAEVFIQTNVNLSEEDNKILTLMMVQNGYDNRSAFVRWLIRQEWARRNQLIQTAGVQNVQADQQ